VSRSKSRFPATQWLLHTCVSRTSIRRYYYVCVCACLCVCVCVCVCCVCVCVCARACVSDLHIPDLMTECGARSGIAVLDDC
jgi:hypothetical protein